MFLDAHVGKVVLLHVQKEFVEANPAFFQKMNASLIYARLRGCDEMGIWVEHPEWETHPVGGPPEVHTLHFWIPWRALISVGAFPDRVFKSRYGEEESSGARAVGFRVSDEPAH